MDILKETESIIWVQERDNLHNMAWLKVRELMDWGCPETRKAIKLCINMHGLYAWHPLIEETAEFRGVAETSVSEIKRILELD